MSPKFIELHWYGKPALINLDLVVSFQNQKFSDINEHTYIVDETYEEIKQLITEAQNSEEKEEKFPG